MRILYAVIIALLVGAGCTAVENFGRFTFPGDQDLGSVANDLAAQASDLSGPTGQFGSACSGNDCTTPNVCQTGFPSGMCTHVCAIDNDCKPNGVCSPILGGRYCLPTCVGPAADGGVDSCRDQYRCCAGGKQAQPGSGGHCEPISTCPQ